MIRYPMTTSGYFNFWAYIQNLVLRFAPAAELPTCAYVHVCVCVCVCVCVSVCVCARAYVLRCIRSCHILIPSVNNMVRSQAFVCLKVGGARFLLFLTSFVSAPLAIWCRVRRSCSIFHLQWWDFHIQKKTEKDQIPLSTWTYHPKRGEFEKKH